MENTMDEHPELGAPRHMIQVFSATASDLEELRSQLVGDDGEAGSVSEVPRGSMLNFDPALVDQPYFKLIGVLLSAGLPKLIDWSLAALRRKSPSDPPIILQVGKRKVELTAGTPPHVVRAVLKDLLERR
jgi:hypothetical protein